MIATNTAAPMIDQRIGQGWRPKLTTSLPQWASPSTASVRARTLRSSSVSLASTWP